MVGSGGGGASALLTNECVATEEPFRSSLWCQLVWIQSLLYLADQCPLFWGFFFLFPNLGISLALYDFAICRRVYVCVAVDYVHLSYAEAECALIVFVSP